MTREDAIKGLRNVANWHYGKYEQTGEEDYLNDGDFLTAVANMLKAQEPRVMTLDEVLRLKFDDVVFFEMSVAGVVISAIVIDVIEHMSDGDIGLIQFRHIQEPINNADLEYYGKTWRCWTSRPDQATREAVKWDS